MSRPVFIYGLYEGEELRYIGQSVNPNVRLISHQSEARKGATSARGIWLRSLQEAGRPVRLVVLAEADAATADGLEREFIARHAAPGRLVNATHGGGGMTRGSPKVRRSISWAQSLDDAVVDRAAALQIPCSTLIETLVREILGFAREEDVAS